MTHPHDRGAALGTAPRSPTDDMTRSEVTTLYRAFDCDGALLYVGIADDWLSRWRAHRKESAWFGDVASVKVEDFDSRPEAESAERAAIRAERPKWNVMHNTRKPPRMYEVMVRCDVCGHHIDNGDGWITVDAPKAYRAENAYVATMPRDLAAKRRLVRVRIDVEPAARWHAFHKACDPNIHDAGAYWFNIARFRTATEVHDWTDHLTSKTWVDFTDWHEFVDRIGRRTPA